MTSMASPPRPHGNTASTFGQDGPSMSELSDENVQNVLVRHGAELKTLSEGFRETNLKLDQVFTELRSLGNNLTIISSQPNVSVSDIFDNIIKVGTIAGLAVAGILYVNQAFI